MEPNRWPWDEISKDRHLPEFEEGRRASQQAQLDDDDDD